MQQTILIIVTGKVQGVWYRQHTLQEAQALGITGYVKNQNDGTVFIKATGSPAQLEGFIRWCHTGSPRSSVTAVVQSPAPLQLFTSFTIER